MKRILLVEDMAIFREPIAATLEGCGYQVTCAANGREAMNILELSKPDLILLDVSMPVMDGISFLMEFRSDARWNKVPVILLTAVADRVQVVKAKELRVQGYLLKSHFSLDELLELIRKTLDVDGTNGLPSSANQIQPAIPPRSRSDKPLASTALANESGEVRQPLSRQVTLPHIKSRIQGRALSGAVTEVLNLTSSSQTDVPELTKTIGRDPVLATRILQVANSAAFVGYKRHISDMNEAVQRLGFSTIREITVQVGLFDAFFSNEYDIDAIRCWEHALAVAAIMAKLTSGYGLETQGIGEIVGLCHDLGEIVLRQEYPEEYKLVQQRAVQGLQPLAEIEESILGMSHQEASVAVLSTLGLPPIIISPIEEFFNVPGAQSTKNAERMGCALSLANYYSNGLGLASTPLAPVAPILTARYRDAIGMAEEIQWNDDEIRTHVLSVMYSLANIKPSDQERFFQPLLPREDVKLLYVRHPLFAEFDPLKAALSALAWVEIQSALPTHPDELGDCRGMLIAVPATSLDDLSLAAAQRLAPENMGKHLGIAYITEQDAEMPSVTADNVTVLKYPLSLLVLRDWITSLTSAKEDK